MPNGHAHAHARPHVTYHAKPVHITSHHVAPRAVSHSVAPHVAPPSSTRVYVPPSHAHHANPIHTNRAAHIAHRAAINPFLSHVSTSTHKGENEQVWSQGQTLGVFGVVVGIILLLAWWIAD